MNLKAVARIVLIIAMLGSAALIGVANYYPLFSTSTPRAEFSSWSNCRASGGVYNCYTKFTVAKASAECSEMDDRTTSVAVFSAIWGLACLHTVAVMIWEILHDGSVPIHNLAFMLFAWTGGLGLLLVIVLVQTLVASLCGSPLTFTQQSGVMEMGGFFFCGAEGCCVIAFLFYLIAPEGDDTAA